MRKNITLLSGLVLFSGAIQAQVNTANANLTPAYLPLTTQKNLISSDSEEKADGDLLWDDDFGGGETWTVGTSGQGTFEIGTAVGPLITYMGNTTSTTAGNGYAFFNGIQYLLSTPPDVQPQNTWVASPNIDLTGILAVQISFQQRYKAFNTDVTYVEISNDGGTTWTTSEVVNSTIPVNQTVQNTLTVDLAVTGSATTQIRFRWENPSDDDSYGSGYGWMVDDVKIYAGFADNVSLVSTFNTTGDPVQLIKYTKFAASQATSGNAVTSFSAKVKNTGYNTHDISLQVQGGSYDQTGAGVTVAPFARAEAEILAADGYTIPVATGSTTFTYTAVVPGTTLVQTTDDSKTASFEVTPFVTAVDGYTNAASISGSYIGTTTQAEGDLSGIGTVFEIFEDGEIGAFDIGIATVSSPSIYNGREFFVTLLKYDGADFQYEMETDPVAVATGDYGKIKKIRLNDPVAVSAGDLILVLACSYIGPDNAGTATGGVPIARSGLIHNSNFIATLGPDYPNDLGQFTYDDDSLTEAPVVRIDFQSYVGLDEQTTLSSVGVAPNPFNATTAVNFELKSSANVAVEVVDLEGRVVMMLPTAKFNAGANTITLDGSAFQAGVYVVKMNVDGNVITKRIVKK